MPCQVAIQHVLKLVNPIETPPWRCGKYLTLRMVDKAVRAKNYIARPLLDKEQGSALAHAKRIAFLIDHHWSDSIEVDVGIPVMGYTPKWPVLDGNHRFYAALVRKDTHISVTISGSLQYASELFKVSQKSLIEPPAEPIIKSFKKAPRAG